MTSTSAHSVERELRDALELVARRPGLPPTYMALMLHQDHRELTLRLQAAAAVGWLTEQRACCGQQARYAITAAGRAVL